MSDEIQAEDEMVEDQFYPVILTAFNYASEGWIEDAENHIATLNDVWGDYALWVAARTFVDITFNDRDITKVALDTLVPNDEQCECCGDEIETDEAKKFILLYLNDGPEGTTCADFWFDIDEEDREFLVVDILTITSRYVQEMDNLHQNLDSFMKELDSGTQGD